MKNDMGLIIESWRKSSINEGIVDLIKSKKLDDKSVEKIGKKLSDEEGFKMAVQLFSSLSEIDSEEMKGLDEGAGEWINSAVVSAMIAKESLVDTLKSDPRFAPVLKLGAPALALALLYFKHKTGSIQGSDYVAATEIIVKNGNIGLEKLADAVLMEKYKNQEP